MDARVDHGDYEFTPKFFEYKNLAQGEIECDFPVPNNQNIFNFLISNAGKQFMAGSWRIIAKIRAWCLQQKIAVEDLDIFTRRYFDVAVDENEDLAVREKIYSEGVPALFHIEKLLQHPHITKKNEVIIKMLAGLSVCPSGTYTNIINARDELLVEVNLPHAFMRIRKTIAEQFVIESLRKSNARNDVGMEIHYVSAILYEHRNIIKVEADEDEVGSLCNINVLRAISKKIIVAMPQLLGLEKILDAVLQGTEFESLIDNIKRKGYVATNEFAEKLDGYGKEGALRLLQMDDVVESKDEYQTFQLCWSAPYVIRISLLYRLAESGFINLYYQRQDHADIQYHYLKNESLKFAYIVDENDAGGKIYQPMLVFLVKQIAVNPGLLARLVSKDSFLELQQRIEVVNTCIDYFNSLNEEEQSVIYTKLANVVKDAFKLNRVLTFNRGVFLQRFLADTQPARFVPHLMHQDDLNILLPIMRKTDASRCLLYFFKKKIKIVSGTSMLVLAARYGLEDLVEKLLKKSVRSAKSRITNTRALHAACEYGHDIVVAQLLSHNHLNIDGRNNDGFTPLLLAIIGYHPAIVEALISFDANVNLHGVDNETPLYLAVKRDSASLVKVLLAADAAVGLTPNHQSLLEFAITRDQYDIAVMLAHHVRYPVLKTIQVVYEELLHAVILKNDIAVATRIIRASDPDNLSCLNDDYESPLYLAVAHNRYEIAKLLLAAGCDPNDEGSIYDKRPIVAAVMNKDIRMFFLLLRYRADYKISANGLSLSSIIKKYGIPGMQRVLDVQETYLCLENLDDIHNDAFDRLRQTALESKADLTPHCHYFRALQFISRIKLTDNADNASFAIHDIRISVLHALHYYITTGNPRSDYLALLRYKCTTFIIAAQRVSFTTMIYNFFYKKEETTPNIINAQLALEKLELCLNCLNSKAPVVEAEAKRRRVGNA